MIRPCITIMMMEICGLFERSYYFSRNKLGPGHKCAPAPDYSFVGSLRCLLWMEVFVLLIG